MSRLVTKREANGKKKKNKGKSSSQRDSKVGAIKNDDGIPYNYIIIIDAGSKGSRAYIYNWLSTEYMLANGKLEGVYKHGMNLELVKRIDVSHTTAETVSNDDNHSESNDDSDVSKTKVMHLPEVSTGKKWYKKINPGISEFNEDSSRIGQTYLNFLLKKVYEVIPIQQHYRTPIFLHATAGMRLLQPNEQDEILNNICYYLQKETNFYLPDCQSHINIIDGDIEGLYGWIALNYLTGTISASKQSVGLLEMGGASTQISFQPNKAEMDEHSNQLIRLQLSSLGVEEPDLNYDIFSTSLLGYGISQIHLKYLDSLNNVTESSNVLRDPCSPKGYTETITLEEKEYQVVGDGDYDKCNDFIYPLVVKGQDKCDAGNRQEVSNCLLPESIPSFSFEVDNFYGVSGYWDTISKLLDIGDNDQFEEYGKIYAYDEIETEAKKICSQDWQALKSYKSLKEDELSGLCFKSLYLLNLLHNGLGLDKNAGDRNKFQVNDKVNGSEFTWTLGRALLYASDESSIEYYNYVNNHDGNSVVKYPKVGYFHNSSPGLFIRGSETDGIPLRPAFEIFDTYDPPGFLRFLDEQADESTIVVGKKSFLKKHSSLFFISLIILAFFAMVHKSKVLRFFGEFAMFFVSMYKRFVKSEKAANIHWPIVTRKRYKRLRSLDLENRDIHLNDLYSVEEDDGELQEEGFNDLEATTGSSESSSNRGSGGIGDRRPEQRQQSPVKTINNVDGEDYDDDMMGWEDNDVIDNDELSDIDGFTIGDDESDDGIERAQVV
ncbi:hypothetical protein CANARDRAFT_27928 [[Candida] arabinofermentans NRRL YB-2248]|uniref:Golgi apyrase n=1 Tax=[Candida] arabinofermentans NRRL YB-2248 TaxID=983967 RepID=A0A1E4T275_9ASCO|nr:hypothetical protein CANARDRAFT_27928 [[Candida] arabinofermentans NRRL YB-2248]